MLLSLGIKTLAARDHNKVVDRWGWLGHLLTNSLVVVALAVVAFGWALLEFLGIALAAAGVVGEVLLWACGIAVVVKAVDRR